MWYEVHASRYPPAPDRTIADLAAVDLNLLVSLDVLLDERSVRGAARRLGLSPSAMSHTLARLRDLLDDEVLVRAGRRMVPTQRAERLAGPVKALLANARAVLAPDDDVLPTELSRAFRVVCTDHVATVLMPHAEALLSTEAPRVDVVLAPLTPDTMSDLRRGIVDAAIGVFPEAPPEMRVRRLFADRFVTVCRAEHPRLHDVDDLSLEAFLDEQHMLVAPRGTPHGHVDRVLDRMGRQRRISRAIPGFLAAMWHLEHTDSLLTVSQRLVEAMAPRLAHRAFPPPVPLDDYTLVLTWHPRADAAAEDRWFRSALLRAAEAIAPLPSAG